MLVVAREVLLGCRAELRRYRPAGAAGPVLPDHAREAVRDPAPQVAGPERRQAQQHGRRFEHLPALAFELLHLGQLASIGPPVTVVHRPRSPEGGELSEPGWECRDPGRVNRWRLVDAPRVVVGRPVAHTTPPRLT